MQSILEEFAYGNVIPEDRFFKRDSDYGQALGAASRNEEKLLGKLEGEEKALFEKFSDAQDELNQLTAVRNLVRGYKLGVLMTAEAFVSSDDLIA